MFSWTSKCLSWVRDQGIICLLCYDTNISFYIISRHVLSLSCHVMSYHIISYHIISYHIISYHIISYHIISYHIISYHIISHHIMSHHIISYHIISYHIISYHIISPLGHTYAAINRLLLILYFRLSTPSHFLKTISLHLHLSLFDDCPSFLFFLHFPIDYFSLSNIIQSNPIQYSPIQSNLR